MRTDMECYRNQYGQIKNEWTTTTIIEMQLHESLQTDQTPLNSMKTTEIVFSIPLRTARNDPRWKGIITHKARIGLFSPHQWKSIKNVNCESHQLVKITAYRQLIPQKNVNDVMKSNQMNYLLHTFVEYVRQMFIVRRREDHKLATRSLSAGSQAIKPLTSLWKGNTIHSFIFLSLYFPFTEDGAN